MKRISVTGADCDPSGTHHLHEDYIVGIGGVSEGEKIVIFLCDEPRECDAVVVTHPIWPGHLFGREAGAWRDIDYRAPLAAALRRVAEGGDIGDEELNALVPPDEAREFSGPLMDAYVHLAQWADDADIRAKEPDDRYADFKRASMRRTLAKLDMPE